MYPPTNLRTSAENRSLIVFLGAGASASMVPGVPTWQRLADNMIDAYKDYGGHQAIVADTARKCLGKTNDLKYVLEELEKAGQSFFYETISRVLEPALSPIGNRLGLAQLLNLLNPPLIITLSWDRILDKTGDYEILTWRDSFAEPRTLRNRYSRKIRTLLHLHGHISRPETLIATITSYKQLYQLEQRGMSSNIEHTIKGFRDKTGPNGLSKLLTDAAIDVLVLGINPAGPEFLAILDTCIGSSDTCARFHIVAPRDESDRFNENIKISNSLGKVGKSFKVYSYEPGAHELVVEFVAKLCGATQENIRVSIEGPEPWTAHYRAYTAQSRTQYLADQQYIEQHAGELWYATEIFTNVFGDDTYISSVARQAADKAAAGAPSSNFVQQVEQAMRARRDGVRDGVRDGRIRSIRCMFWKHTEDTDQRVAVARSLCKGTSTQIEVRLLDFDRYVAELDPGSPALSPSFALIFGASDARYRLALAHAHQATSARARFQWIHVNTDFAQERAAWFMRAWQSAHDYP